MEKDIVELAKLFKDRDNKSYDGFLIGKVISPPPSTMISIDENIILDNDNLIFSAHMLSNYERSFEVYDATINSFSGKIKTTDTLKKGDEVILLPSSNVQIYVVWDKAVKF